jgi:hypothetical protein
MCYIGPHSTIQKTALPVYKEALRSTAWWTRNLKFTLLQVHEKQDSYTIRSIIRLHVDFFHKKITKQTATKILYCGK